MSSPKLSIIIPVFNVEQYIAQTLDSLCCQQDNDIEIIIIDDGSTDASAEICDRYSESDARIMVVHTSNGGVSKARNRGLQMAKGEIVTFVDSDDWVEPDYCSTIITEMHNVDLIIFNAYIHRIESIEKTSFAHNGVYQTDLDIADALSEVHYPKNRLGWPWNKAFKNEIIKKNNIQFPEDISLFEDEVFVLRYCSKIQSLRIIPHALYYYRVVENSLSFRKIEGVMYDKIANYIDDLSGTFKQERFLSGLYWQVMWLKLKAYKLQKCSSYQQFCDINLYYKSRMPIIRRSSAKVMHVVFGKNDVISYCMYSIAHLIHKI